MIVELVSRQKQIPKYEEKNPIKCMWEQDDVFEFMIFQDLQQTPKSNSVFWEPDEQQMLKGTTAFLILINLKLDPTENGL